MDGTSLKGSTSSSGAPFTTETVQKRTEEEAREWAAALNIAVAPSIRALAAPCNEGSSSPWRSMDNPLTRANLNQLGVVPRSTAFNSASMAGSGPSADPTEGTPGSRLTLSVSTGELGELSVTVDRGEHGIRVLIGVADPSIASRIEPERAALARSLAAAGLDVDAVSIVPLGTPFGTVLAHSRSQGHPANSSKTRPGKHPSDQEQRLNRGVHRLSVKG